MTYRILPYRFPVGTLTDLYQLTMGQVYWLSGMSDWQAVFHHSFRTIPDGGGYAVAAGLEFVCDYLENLKFTDDDIAYLATLVGNDGKPVFRREYLDFLARLEFDCDVDAVREGSAVFPHSPLLRVKGPLITAQLIETAILTFANHQTAIATKAARICDAAGDLPVLEFGLRRAPGVDGAFSATRAAYIGGCTGTSNVWAAQHLGLPPQAIKGTMAHSLVMCFESELEAFSAYSEAMPNNCVFLVDTYGTIEGIRNAIQVGVRLRERGHEMIGIRLDSGDLAKLSRRGRKLLDAAGFQKAGIIASNDLQEHLITSLREQEASITVFAVGTKLMAPSIGGVYKLGAIKKPGHEWEDRVKLSDQPVKVSIPGTLQVRRFRTDNGNLADLIFDEQRGISDDGTMIHLNDQTRQARIPEKAVATDLLVPVFRGGKCIYELPSLDEIRRHRQREFHFVSKATRRFANPDEYPPWLERSLFLKRLQMILERRSVDDLESF